jgi:hypothetical protein
MKVSRVLAWLFLLLAMMCAGAEIVRSLEASAWEPLAFGYLWFMVDPGSLNFSQAIIQRYVHPTLWDPVIVTVLQWPMWLVLGIPGVILWLFSRRKKQRRWFAK